MGGMPPMSPMGGGMDPAGMGGMPPMGGGMNDPMGGMDDPMGGDMDDAGMGDEVSPKKSIQQQCGSLTSDMRNYLETADPEDANELALWILKMVNKAGAPVLNNKGKKSVIDAIKGVDEEDFEGLDDEDGTDDGMSDHMGGDAGMGNGDMNAPVQ